ncbi:flavodoxin family protein [Methylobacterium sp. P31]
MREVLIVFYSRSGTTGLVAQALATALGADLDRITTATSYAGAAGYMRGIWHALRQIGPPVRRHFDPGQFKTVVLCSPVWAGRLSGPMRTYLREAGEMAHVFGVAVSGSGGPQTSFFREMERISGRAGIPALSLSQRQVLTGAYRPALDAFAQKVRHVRGDAAEDRPRAGGDATGRPGSHGLPDGGLIA